MALEDKIDALIAALKENTAVHAARSNAAPAEATDDAPASTETRGRRKKGETVAAEPTSPPPPPPEPEPTVEEVTDIALALKNVVGKNGAVELIKKHGAEKLVDLPPANFKAFVAAAKAAIAAAGDEEI